MDTKIAKRCLALDKIDGDRPKQGARRTFTSCRLSLVLVSLGLMFAPLTGFAEGADALDPLNVDE